MSLLSRPWNTRHPLPIVVSSLKQRRSDITWWCQRAELDRRVPCDWSHHVAPGKTTGIRDECSVKAGKILRIILQHPWDALTDLVSMATVVPVSIWRLLFVLDCRGVDDYSLLWTWDDFTHGWSSITDGPNRRNILCCTPEIIVVIFGRRI